MESPPRVLSLIHSISLMFAIVVGAGLFRVPAEIAARLPSPALILLCWFVGGLICLLGALCYAELSASFPVTGGSYIYLRESYSSGIGFLFGWAELLVINSGSLAAVAFIFSEYLCSLLGAGPQAVKPAAVAVIAAVTLLNLAGLRRGHRLHDLLNFVKIAALFFALIVAVASLKGDWSRFLVSGSPAERSGFSAFGLALIPILWTYGGWHESSVAAGETRDAEKNLPASLLLGLAGVVVVYIAFNALYLYLFPIEELARSPLIASDAFAILFGPPGRKAVEGLIVLSALGSLNAMVITGSRVTYAMAEDHRIFRYLSGLGGLQRTPRRAIAIVGLWSSVMVAVADFGKLLYFTGILVWAFFGLVAASIFILRRTRPDLERPYRAWGYPWVPGLFALACAALFLNTLLNEPRASAAGLLIAATGIPLFILSRRMKPALSMRRAAE